MKQIRRWQRTLILALISLSVIAPLVFVSHRLKVLTPDGRREFLDDLSSFTYRTDPLKLNAIEQEGTEKLEEPKQVIYRENDFGSAFRNNSEMVDDSEESIVDGNRSKLLEINELDPDKRQVQEAQQKELSSLDGHKKKFDSEVTQNQSISTHPQRMTDRNIEVIDKKSNKKVTRRHQILHSQSRGMTNHKVEEIKDQIVRARAYLNFIPSTSHSHLVKELKLVIKEMGHAVGEATRDSDLPRSALQKLRRMEATLSKAHHAFPDCSAMAAKLRAMNLNAEAQLRTQQNQETYLVHLAARTTPKGLHCLSMRLTADYFALTPEERTFPNENKIHDPQLYHYAVFSDNVLACAVVVNSTVSTAKEEEKLVFHVVTNALYFPAISMWFLLNPPGKATIHIQSLEEFEWLSKKYETFKKYNSSDLRYTSELNYLRFYLPEIFPTLNKIVLFDHDVVVQQDLSQLWNANMNGKIIAAVGTCEEGETSFRRMDMFINFSDSYIAERFDVNACTWAFGINLFDLQQWRRHNLIAVYHKYLQMGSKGPLWNIGSLPIGWLTFYNNTMVLGRRWQVLGLGYDSDVDGKEIEQGAVLHYDGIRKPWMEIAMGRYKSYWTKFLNFDHPFLQRCNIQP